MKSSQWAISILKDHRNKLWLGTYGGLFQVNEKDTLSPLKIDDKDFLNRKKVYDIQEDKQHRLWVGTATGLYSIGENRDQYQAHQVSRINQLSITAIMPDEFHLWLGTWGEGFKFFDPVTQQVRTYTTKDGLASNFVHAIFKAKDDVLWISTENGLSQFDLQHNTFKNYYAKDGLPGNTFNHKALGYDGKMTLYLGGKKGIVAFIPEKVGKRTQHSIVKISRIEQYVGKENRLQSYVFNAHLQQSITLNYRDKFLSVYFSTHDLLSQPPLAYQLEGFHNEWQVLGKKKNIQFASLPPGDYNL
jgi:ligand-binding sensor domain-containing protein